MDQVARNVTFQVHYMRDGHVHLTTRDSVNRKTEAYCIYNPLISQQFPCSDSLPLKLLLRGWKGACKPQAELEQQLPVKRDLVSKYLRGTSKAEVWAWLDARCQKHAELLKEELSFMNWDKIVPTPLSWR